MKDPAFLFYYKDFLVSTTFMTLEEIGAYVKLLCFQADRGHLAEENIKRKIPLSVWDNIKEKFIKDENGYYYNARLDMEIEKRKLHSEHQKKNAYMRWHKSGICDGIALAMPLVNANANANKDVNVIKEKGVIGEKEQLRNSVAEVIVDLNSVLGTNYKDTTAKTIELIGSRIKEGFKLNDFKAVHRKMAQAWGLDNKMRQYLRPITLYSTKFESYLNRPEDIADLTHQQQANLKALAKFNEEMKNDNRGV